MPTDSAATPEFTIVTRDITLDAAGDEAWDLIGDAAGWAGWMVDSADIDVAPGASGRVVDDGQTREVQVDEVVPGRSVRFVWWPSDSSDRASSVSLTVDTIGDATVLRVVEVFPPAAAPLAARASFAWEVRAVGAWTSCLAPSRV